MPRLWPLSCEWILSIETDVTLTRPRFLRSHPKNCLLQKAWDTEDFIVAKFKWHAIILSHLNLTTRSQNDVHCFNLHIYWYCHYIPIMVAFLNYKKVYESFFTWPLVTFVCNRVVCQFFRCYWVKYRPSAVCSVNVSYCKILSYCTFFIYTHPVNSKFTIWQ